MEATTKQFEVIPDIDGNQILTIPASVIGTLDQLVDNPTIDVSTPKLGGSSLSFDIHINYMNGSVPMRYSVSQSYTYEEVAGILSDDDLSGLAVYGGYVDGLTSVLQMMSSLADVFDLLLQNVSWLQGKIQVKPIE